MDHVEIAPQMNKTDYQFVVHTFGCKVNTYDSGLIQKNIKSYRPSNQQDLKTADDSLALHNGFSKQVHPSKVHVLNTCAVTAEATQQAVRLIRKIKSKEPLATIVVTGCAAQVDTGAFEKITAADLIVANSHKGLLPQLLDQHFKGQLKERIFKSNIFKKEDLEIGGGEEKNHTRSFLKIQDGCNSFCTFCIIPYARGKSRSIPVAELVRKIQQLESEGLKEVVLTGVHIGDYEDEAFNGKKVLEDLVESVLLKTKISRIRLSSLEPIELSDRLLDLYSDQRLCPHFHMSIQSANTQVLADMKRKYTQDQVRQSLEAIHKNVKNAFVGMDVIAGFPTETEELFEDTYKALADLPWTRLHVFPYSERSGTRAATLPQLHQMIRKDRGQKLRELSHHRLTSEALKQVGTVKDTLLLKADGSVQQGLSRDYWPVQIILNENELDHVQKLRNTERNILIEEVDLGTNDVSLKGVFV